MGGTPMSRRGVVRRRRAFDGGGVPRVIVARAMCGTWAIILPPMPELRDSFSRLVTYLRISVTDRCNFRCVYCMPAEGIETIARDQILTFEEIARVVRVGVSLGLHKVRLTGGEPTVRADLPLLVRMLRSIDGVGEISMTTNASRLDELAAPLKDAGLDRVNISLDSLNRERAAELARRDVLPRVLAGIDAATATGLAPL